ncbi:unnamed protein product [Arctogadus glacialis]
MLDQSNPISSIKHPDDELYSNRIHSQYHNGELYSNRIHGKYPNDQLYNSWIHSKYPNDELYNSWINPYNRIHRKYPNDELYTNRIHGKYPNDELYSSWIHCKYPNDELYSSWIHCKYPNDELYIRRCHHGHLQRRLHRDTALCPIAGELRPIGDNMLLCIRPADCRPELWVQPLWRVGRLHSRRVVNRQLFRRRGYYLHLRQQRRVLRIHLCFAEQQCFVRQTVTVNSVKGLINGTTIQCTFTATIPDATTRALSTSYSLAIVTGTLSSTGVLGNPVARVQTQVLDLSDASSSTSILTTVVTTTVTTTTVATSTVANSGRPTHLALSQALLIILGTMGLALL